MMRPECELKFDPDRKCFRGNEIDSATGVETSWEVRPVLQFTRRIETIPNSGLSRTIEDDVAGKTLFANITEFHIRLKSLDKDKHLGLSLYKPDGKLSVHLNLKHSSGGFNHFNAHYSETGRLRQLSLLGNQQPGTYSEQQDQIRQQESLDTRSYESCFNELVQIAKTNGLTTFFGITGKSMWEKNEPTLESIRGIMQFGLLQHVDKLPREQLTSYYKAAWVHAAKELERLYGEDEFVKTNAEVIALALTIETVDSFGEKPDLTVPFPDLAKDYFEKTIRDLVQDYHDHLQRTGAFMVWYFIEDEGKMNFLVGSQFSMSTPARKEPISMGESFQHDEFTYTLRQAEEANRLELVIGNILRPSVQRKFEIPETVDLAKIYEVVSAPERTGWERALDLAPFEYK